MEQSPSPANINPDVQENGFPAFEDALVATPVDGIITIDFAGTIPSANPAAERMFGYPRGEIIGCSVKMLMPAPYAEEPFRTSPENRRIVS